jgi:iron(III) transport system substrate-binding protein
VLYTSIDKPILDPIIAAFEVERSITVKIVTDTEATKVTGLVKRLLDEKDAPRADVWWSSEPAGTIELARQGVFQRFSSRAELSTPNGWPSALRDPGGMWYAHALRARVIAYNISRVPKSEAPMTLRALTDPRWSGRVGMARPQFGSTRTHLAALIAACGEDATRTWMQAMANNKVRLYDGNSAVAHAIALGEIEVGLTDTDDVWSEQRNKGPIDFNFEKAEAPGSRPPGRLAIGPVVLPCTIARVRKGPNPGEAQQLIDFLLSPAVERLLAQSEAHHQPIRPDLAREFAQYAIPRPAEVSLDAVATALPVATRLANEVFGSN